MSLIRSLLKPYSQIERVPFRELDLITVDDPDYIVVPLEYPEQILYEPVVKIGNSVRKYQIIGRSRQGHCIHASVSGEVQDILLIWTTHSFHVPGLLIKRNDLPPCPVDEVFEQFGVPFEAASNIEKLKAMGVLSPWTRPGRFYREADENFPEIKKIVIHAADEEPSVYVNDFIVQAYPEKIQKGLSLVKSLSPRTEIILAVSDYLEEQVRKQFDHSVTIKGIKPAYKERLELLMVPRITGEAIPLMGAYRSKGVARISAEFLLTMVDALEQNRPFISKLISLGGAGIEKPLTLEVPIGTTIRHILESIDVNADDVVRILAGGPMKGIGQYTDLTPVTKKNTGLYLLAGNEAHLEADNNTCINCGKCTRTCPVGLQVHLIGRYAEFEQLAEVCRFHPELCIECGLCAYVCPAERPLVQLIQLSKKYMGMTYESNQPQIECSPQSSLEKWHDEFKRESAMDYSVHSGTDS